MPAATESIPTSNVVADSERVSTFSNRASKESGREAIHGAIDVFDYYEEGYEPEMSVRPPRGYAYGADHKANFLKKAAKLGFYEKLIYADFVKDTSIANSSLDRVYCNSLYWVCDTATALNHRVSKLKPGGRIVLNVMTTRKKRFDYKANFPTAPREWQEWMNRGRQDTNPGMSSEHGWEKLFKTSGLELTNKRAPLPGAIAPFWNLGMRPIFPVLQKMTKMLTHENRKEIKAEWIDLWETLLMPILDCPQDFTKETHQIRWQFQRTRKK